ncbi:hypothetical protein BHM03_00042421 [Ensete ventricosum]|nr:hypothetical protein BHM03_00042421 [Ensete ventricosum]
MMLEQKVQTLTCWTWGCSDYESLREGGEQQRRRRPDITEEEEEEETKAAIGSSLPSIVGAPSVDGGFLYLVPVESQRDLALLEQDLWGFFIGPKDAEVAVQGRVIIRTCFMVTAWKEVYSSGKTTENPTELKHDVAYGPYDDVALFPLFLSSCFYSVCFHDYFPTDIAAYPYCHWKRPVGRGGARSPRPQLETRFRDGKGRWRRESAPTTSGVANQVRNPCVTVAHERGQRPWPT